MLVLNWENKLFSHLAEPGWTTGLFRLYVWICWDCNFSYKGWKKMWKLIFEYFGIVVLWVRGKVVIAIKILVLMNGCKIPLTSSVLEIFDNFGSLHT